MSGIKLIVPGLLLIPFLIIYPQRIIQNGDIKYLANRVVIKMKDQQSNSLGNVNLSSSIQSKLSPYNVTNVAAKFKLKGNKPNPLRSIVTVEYSSDIDPLLLSAKLRNTEGVLWAEPHYVYSIVPFESVPNDTFYSKQWYLQKINAEQAWGISKGDTSVIIAITDTGVDWDHPDLAANIWINRNEIPDNGIDDDNNGYVDDIRGWDFSGLDGITHDNNPMENTPFHGTAVAGIASAVSNNATGIASIGYNCRIMPVKSSGNNQSFHLLEGMLYAIENGAKVINCSFGAQCSKAGEEMINYGISKGVLVVSAAGNSSSSSGLVFPSRVSNVFSVGATNSEDKIASFSTYGRSIDVCAPGENIYTTFQNNTYTTFTGTSGSSPLVAGLAGLVFSKFPTYTPLQVAEQIRVNCDNIDTLNDSKYALLLGRGRINAYKALNNIDSKSVRACNVTFNDEQPKGNGNNILEAGETITANVKFRNFLQPVHNLSVTLESKVGYAEIENPVFNCGNMGTLDSSETKFYIKLKNSNVMDLQLGFLLNYSDGTYNDFQWIEVKVNPSYYTQHTGLVSLTITSYGALGYNDYGAMAEGDGFQYKDNYSSLFLGSLILGNAKDKVSDAAYSANINIQSNDFVIAKPFKLTIPGIDADEQGFGIFSDNGNSKKLGILTELNSYSFYSSPYNKFIILKYRLKNIGQAGLSNLFAGLFFDWSIEEDGCYDIVKYDSSENFGYAYSNFSSKPAYIGSALISQGSPGFYAINGPDHKQPPIGFGIYDGFTDAEKFYAISNGISKPEAGPGDISFVISGGPYNMEAGESVDVAFAIAAGDDLEDLRTSIQMSRQKYQVVTNVNSDLSKQTCQFRLEQNYPNPFNPVTTIEYSIPARQGGNGKNFVTLKVYDILGKEIAALVNEEKAPGNYYAKFDGSNLSSGVYLYRINAGNFTSTKKLILIK